MLKNKDITVVIPVHVYDEEVANLLDNAIKSVPKDVKVIISTDDKFDLRTSTVKDRRVTWVANETEDTSFQNLVNLGVKEVKTDWFSILEFDDVYTPIWFDSCERYQKFNKKYNAFFPLVDLYAVKDKNSDYKIVGHGNESP